MLNEFFEYKQSQLRVITELLTAVLRTGVGITDLGIREQGSGVED
jgi:hypothetical protein